jgi:hypothetical protein
MKRLLFGLVVLPFAAGIALAGPPVPRGDQQPAPTQLSDEQMDGITAGFDFREIDIQNLGSVGVLINNPPAACTGCFLSIKGTTFPAGVQSFQLFAEFGPALGGK